MIIGIDASRANKDHKTGTEWYSYYLIRWLAKLDDQNQYVLYSDKPLKGGLLDLRTEQYVEDNIKCEIPTPGQRGWQEIKSPHNNFRAKILRWPFKHLWTQGGLSLEMILHRPDILFIPSHTLPFIHPRKSVVTIHDIGFERDQKLFSSDVIGPEGKKSRKALNFFVFLFTLGKYQAKTIDYLRWSTKFALKHAAKIITVSEFSQKEICSFYHTDTNKISVVHNGYNEYLFKNQPNNKQISEILNKYGIEQPYLFYIGRIEKKKNIPALIEAFAIMLEKNPGIKHKLVLVGDASYGYDETKYAIRQFELTDRVILAGWLNETEIPYLYFGADAFVFPSNYEGFGIPLLQAMAAGTPITASNTSSIPEVVGDAALLFNPQYVSQMAEAMARIIKDRDLRENLVKKGQERIKRFSWQKSAKQTLKILKSL